MLRAILFLMMIFTCNVWAADNADAKLHHCTSKEDCINDPNCLCWCSQICNWRKKTAEDRPVYIANDPHKKFCYCKQWDYEHYVDNCIEGKHIKEPKDAK